MKETFQSTDVLVVNRSDKGLRDRQVPRVKKRHPNHRLVKIHRSYKVEEIAGLLEVHKNTVRRWIKEGLPTIDDKRPRLILGHELIAFLHARRTNKKQRCRPGQMYCVRCRLAKFPRDGMVEYRPIRNTVGNLTAICPDCSSRMHRLLSMAKLGEFCEKMDAAFPQALPHIREIIHPTLNGDLRGDVQL